MKVLNMYLFFPQLHKAIFVLNDKNLYIFLYSNPSVTSWWAAGVTFVIPWV